MADDTLMDKCLFDLVKDIRTTQLNQAATMGKIEANVESLCGPQGRVTALETSRTRQWWVTVAIAPALSGLFAIARKFGVTI